MANRRMISMQVINTDAFMDMPVSSQALYFHMLVRADDDGFVSPKMIMRMVGASEEDIGVLMKNRYILRFDSGIIVIKHWLIHNLIRSDLYKETSYLEEKSKLGLNDFGAYTELREGVAELKKIEPPKWLRKRRKQEEDDDGTPTVRFRDTGKDRLGKDSIGKYSKDKEVTVSEKENKKKFGEMGYVKLSDEEYEKLCESIGEKNTLMLIEEMDDYLGSTGKKYKSHYKALRNWARRKAFEKIEKTKNDRRIV